MSVEDRPEHQPHREVLADESWDTALSPPPSQIEAQQRAEIEKLHQPFLIASVCRADLQDILTDEEIASLDDTDMERIADKMGDSYRDSGAYWNSLEINTRFVLGRKNDGNI